MQFLLSGWIPLRSGIGVMTRLRWIEGLFFSHGSRISSDHDPPEVDSLHAFVRAGE